MKPLQIPEVLALAEIIASCGKRIRFLNPDRSRVLVGTSRSVGDANGMFLGRFDDIRQAYLRVTLESGLDTYIPIESAVRLVQDGAFAVE